MATSYLSLVTSLSGSTYFSDYLSAQDDNLEKIDMFAGNVLSAISAMAGASGTVTLLSSSWLSSVYSLSVSNFGENDCIEFGPATRSDKTALEEANIVITTSNNSVLFDAENTPSTDINLIYFITRG